MDGPSNPHDILRVLGDKALARYLVDEIQEVYKLQGVKINEQAHRGLVRQMLKRVRIREVGDTHFLVDDQVEKLAFEEENGRVIREGGKPALAEPLFLGITKASLITDSFISAASFQETTKVLTQAAVAGKVDYLEGTERKRHHGPSHPCGKRAFRDLKDAKLFVRRIYGEETAPETPTEMPAGEPGRLRSRRPSGHGIKGKPGSGQRPIPK